MKNFGPSNRKVRKSDRKYGKRRGIRSDSSAFNTKLGRIRERRIKRRKKQRKRKEEDFVMINYRDYLLAKAYGGEPRVISSRMSNSSRSTSRIGTKFKSNNKLRQKARMKLNNLS